MSVLPATASDEPTGRRDETLTVEVLAWSPNMSSAMVGSAPAVPGTAFDMGRDLRTQEPTFPEVRAAFSFHGRHSVHLDYTQWHFPGTAVLATPVVFEGTLFTRGSTVTSSLDVNYLRLGYAYTLYRESRLALDALLDFRTVWGDVGLTSGAVGQALSFRAFVPTLGLAVQYQPEKRLELYGEASGMPMSDGGYLYEAETGLRLKPAEQLHVTFGYRVLSFRQKDNADLVRFSLSGPFASAQMNY